MQGKVTRCCFALAIILLLAIAHPVDAQHNYSKDNTMHTVTGQFSIDMEPQQDPEVSVGRMTLHKIYSGELAATGKGQMLSHRTSTTGSAGYVALEHIEGTLQGKSGSFTIQHYGLMAKGESSLVIDVIPDSGTNELEGISGTMQIDIKDGKHFYTLTYALPE